MVISADSRARAAQNFLTFFDNRLIIPESSDLKLQTSNRTNPEEWLLSKTLINFQASSDN